MLGCSDDVDPATGNFPNSGDEIGDTGFSPYDLGPGPLMGQECLTSIKPGAYGYKAQCEGLFLTSLAWTHNGIPQFFTIPSDGGGGFGNDYESYEDAKVMACCAPYDNDETLAEQPHFAHNCMMDARQLACSSMASALGHFIGSNDLPNDEEQALENLRGYLSSESGQTECIDRMGEGHDEMSPMVVSSEWLMDPGLWGVQSVETIEMKMVVTVTDIDQPDSPTICESLHENGDEFLEPVDPPFGDAHILSLVDGMALAAGPTSGAYTFPGQLEMASLLSSCRPGRCSRMSFAPTSGGELYLEELKLYPAQPVTLTILGEKVEVHDPRIELYGSAAGSWYHGEGVNTFSSNPGQARFMIVGECLGEWVTLPAVGSSAISITEMGDEWFAKRFELMHEDGNLDAWTIAVPETEWLKL
ncbi:hypothetical protein PPSIR1_00355 [Plesiocystis pacifica SIR-1]|uniref:Uncharacterized protein n=1 Tax=Plesiocystis pacifica SIR-1 TaxID=391625 RepID=A6GGB7_9BACT|nr:hypothetical protein [Plesiocystis pacifica]EDM75091.1 hypothetical protein PPSIR1_00355 [Plesiocystis pacifica SIR-1]